MMYMDTYDQIIRLPTSRVMQPVQLPQDLILRIILYLIPSQALQWIRHDFHHNRYVRAPMLHEVFGAGCLPTYIDMSRYGGTTYTLLLYNSRIARSRNYLHDTVSRLHIALLNIVYWIPMSSLSRGNVIRTIGICRRHEEHWSYIRPHYPLRTYSFTSRFIISDNLCNRVLVSIEWNWHISDVIFWFAGDTRNMVSEPNMRGQLDPERFMATRHIEHLDPTGNPWHPGYRLNGTPSRRPTTHNLPACAFSIPMSTQHTQQLIQGLQRCRHANHKVHFDILNNDYCLTSHLVAGAAIRAGIPGFVHGHAGKKAKKIRANARKTKKKTPKSTKTPPKNNKNTKKHQKNTKIFFRAYARKISPNAKKKIQFAWPRRGHQT